MPRLFQFKRGTAAVKPTLNDGEAYLERDTNTLVVQNQSTEIRLAKSTDIDNVNSNITTLSDNVASLNTKIDTKLTTPSGTTGQLLGFIANNVVGAVDNPAENPSLYNTKVNATLQTTGWTSVDGQYRYTVNISGMTSDQLPLVFPVWTSNKVNEQKAWNTLDPNVESVDGAVYFYAPSPFTTAVTCTIVFGVSNAQPVVLNNNVSGENIRTEGVFYPANSE